MFSVAVDVGARIHAAVGAGMEGVVATVKAIRTIWTRTQTSDFTRLTVVCVMLPRLAPNTVPALPGPVWPVPPIWRVPLAVNPMVTASMQQTHSSCCCGLFTLLMLQQLPSSDSDSSGENESGTPEQQVSTLRSHATVLQNRKDNRGC